MNKCCIQTPQQATTLTLNIGDICKKKSTTATATKNGINNCNGTNGSNGSNGSNSINGSMPNGNSDHACPATITDAVRCHIERRKCAANDFFREALSCYLKSELIICFNGGKDCTVLLHLLMLYCREHDIDSHDIAILYIESDDSFPEIDEFVEYCVRFYNINLIKYKDSLKAALTQMKEDMPRIKAVFVGSRNTDPYCDKLQPMQRTDSDWPDIMRLNPLLEWNYHDIWHYIHMYSVPYCSLYARGYTSIGYKSNTLPNPHLLRADQNPDEDTPSYKPAWELVDPAMERAGRVSRK